MADKRRSMQKISRHKPPGFRRVHRIMSPRPKLLLVSAYLAGLAGAVIYCAAPAYGSGFSAFAEDEAVCSRAGGAAIKGGSGALAAQRYDFAYRRCMAAYIRMRQMEAYRQSGSNDGYPVGNPHSFDYPDAFYSIPYATPGYGYDGFGY